LKIKFELHQVSIAHFVDSDEINKKSPIWIPEKPIIVSFCFDKNNSITIYKMSYRNICYLEFILRPILELFKAILDLWVHPVSQRSDPVRLPSIAFCG